MVRNLQGRVERWQYFKPGVVQPGAKKGERGFCPKNKEIFPKNPDEVAWPNATEVLDIILWKLNILKAQGWGFCHKSCEGGYVRNLRKVCVSPNSEPDIFAGGVNHTGRQNVQTGKSTTQKKIFTCLNFQKESCTMYMLCLGSPDSLPPSFPFVSDRLTPSLTVPLSTIWRFQNKKSRSCQWGM